MSVLPYYVQYVQAVGPTVVAVIAALFALYIGLRQWKTAHYRLSFDMYEKRYAMYEATKNFLGTSINLHQTTPENFTAFRNGIRGAEFLFDKETRNHLTKLYHMAWGDQILQAKIIQQPNDPDLKEHEEILKFFEQQDKMLEDMFRPYLDLSKAGLRSYWPW
jgi:hypothetical protein